jgi:hypothetical protein
MDMHYKSYTIILITLFLAQSTLCQQFSEKRTFTRSMQVNNETTLEIDNKYGAIHISSCDSDTVTVRAEVEATASKSDRTGKMLEGVNINISETSYLIKAQTEFSQTITMLFESFKGMTNKLIPYDSRIQINYFVDAPEFLNIRITNKYGDVYLEDINGDFSVDLSNGSFKANSISGNTRMNVSFCDVTINKLNEGRIDASFSDVVIGESENLEIKSLSTRFDLKKNNILNTEARRDKYFIGNVRSVKGNSYFTDYRIENLEHEINLDTKYGSIEADYIGKNCEMININSSYTDIYLTFDPSLAYNVDVRHTNAFLVLPEKKAFVEKEVFNEDKKEYMTFGSIGKDPGKLKVIIEATRGNIHLK